MLSASDDGTVRLDACEFCALAITPLRERARQATQSLGPPDDGAAATSAGWRWPGWLGGKP